MAHPTQTERLPETLVAISVCVPVWNDAEWLPRVIESVLAQTYPHWELAISDNASDEDLASRVSRYPDPRIRHVRWPDHVGTYENHNRALSLCRYPWILPIGSDDRLNPDALAVVANRIRRLAADGTSPSMVVAACRRVDRAGSSADRRYYGSQGRKEVRSGLYEARDWLAVLAAPGAPPWNIGSIVFSARALVDAGGAFRPEIGLSADNELVLRLSAYAAVDYVDRPIADFTVRSDSDGNRRFSENRAAGEAETPMGAALASGLRVFSARGLAGPAERRLVSQAIARLYLQRAGQHRILPGGRGRRGAAADVARAIRSWPGLLISAPHVGRAAAAVLAPARAISYASRRLAGTGR